MSLKTFFYTGHFQLESGKWLPELQIGYHTYGCLNEHKNNVVWVCHALTANSDVLEWWPGLFGDDALFNPQEHYIVCANILGSAYGTTNPLSIDPQTTQPYYLNFPQFTIRDMVKAHRLLATHLEIENIEILIGGSLGGQQALEWAVDEPKKIKKLVVMATNAFHSPWGIAFNESQRLCIEADASFFSPNPEGGKKGLKAARSLALLSYRSYQTYALTQAENDLQKTDQFNASSYQAYQGEKLVKRFNSFSYWYLSKAMDSHHLGRNYSSAEEALAKITARTLVVAVESDLLFPPAEQEYLAKNISDASFMQIKSLFGHDGFLIETEALSKIIRSFLKQSITEKRTALYRTAQYDD